VHNLNEQIMSGVTFSKLLVNFYDDMNLLQIYSITSLLCLFGLHFSVLSHVLRHRCMGAGKSWFSVLQNSNKIACFEGS